MPFALTRLRAKDRDSRSALAAITAGDAAVLAPARRWGLFAGLFGLASNELFVVSAGEVQDVGERLLGLPATAEAETLLLEPTVRPTTEAPLTREGLYVFRFFEVAHRDVDEIAELSREAWESFEESDAYAAEPMALFCQADRSAERGRMLLVTWYDGLNSWQTSRRPDPRARENFLRRHELTAGTIAYATRLLA
ncbi:MAG: hypothetical protein CL910_08235 [Deltaproteobacteria bacterium]|nr:hypothetical protein [Deltaproteobacteria bacterium]